MSMMGHSGGTKFIKDLLLTRATSDLQLPRSHAGSLRALQPRPSRGAKNYNSRFHNSLKKTVSDTVFFSERFLGRCRALVWGRIYELEAGSSLATFSNRFSASSTSASLWLKFT